MTLNEYIKQNGSKTIEIQEDGTIRILEEKGPWKPECEEKYYTIYGCGSVETFKWVDCLMDDLRKEMGNVFQTKAEAERMVHRLKARKKFLDAGGHEGIEGFSRGVIYKAFTQCGDNGMIVLKGNCVSAFDIWFASKDDAQKAIDSLTEDEVKALCWKGEEE